MLDIVYGGQWGSEGKGKIAGYLANERDYEAVISCFMPNAGHTYVDGETKLVFKQIPVGSVNPDVMIFLGSTSAINVPLLMEEIENLESHGLDIRNRLFIDPMASIITNEHANWEKEHLTRISSTAQGCGRALSLKVLRSGHLMLARDHKLLQPYIHDTIHAVNNILESGKHILGELAQGFELSLNISRFWPYTTSRDCTPQAFLNDIGVHWSHIRNSIMVVRPYPIRVGNVYDENKNMIGYSGGVYKDQNELSWKQISENAGFNILEKTTVTGKVRRVFEWSDQQYQRAYRITRPTDIALTFTDYLKDDQLKKFREKLHPILSIESYGPDNAQTKLVY